MAKAVSEARAKPPSRPAVVDRLRESLGSAIDRAELTPMRGRVQRAVGTVIHATLPEVRLGEICRLTNPHRAGDVMDAEVVGFEDGVVLLTPIGAMRGVSTRTEVTPTGREFMAPVGDALLGRTIDGLGRPMDAGRKGELRIEERRSIQADPPGALDRAIIENPLPTGVRVIDGFLTAAEGQRIGIYGAPGGGKSTLLASIVEGAQAEIAVVALIGERGREVREFLERDLDPESRERTVAVVATADRPAMERLRAAYVATAIAEHYRAQGKKVLLLMDSLTRFARAQREIGLAAGEPPARRGFPPSVFALLPELVERAGLAETGSITAFYTVLVEGDDMDEPIAEETRAILDGHIVLSKKLGAAGHFPAIDVLASASRVMNAVVSPEHAAAAAHLRRLMAKHKEIELLLQVGEYQHGSDPLADEAIAKIDDITDFLRQQRREIDPFDAIVQRLTALSS